MVPGEEIDSNIAEHGSSNSADATVFIYGRSVGWITTSARFPQLRPIFIYLIARIMYNSGTRQTNERLVTHYPRCLLARCSRTPGAFPLRCNPNGDLARSSSRAFCVAEDRLSFVSSSYLHTCLIR